MTVGANKIAKRNPAGPALDRITCGNTIVSQSIVTKRYQASDQASYMNSCFVRASECLCVYTGVESSRLLKNFVVLSSIRLGLHKTGDISEQRTKFIIQHMSKQEDDHEATPRVMRATATSMSCCSKTRKKRQVQKKPS